MPTYSIEGPDGKIYSIEGPEGATREQVVQAIKSRMQTAPKEEGAASEEKKTSAVMDIDETSQPEAAAPEPSKPPVTPMDIDESVSPQARVVTDYDPTEHEGVPLELIEGISSGVIGIGQGIAELGALGIDLVADTDYASYVTDSANDLRKTLGIDPVGVVGKGAEVLTQFALPGIAAVSAVSKASKLGKAAAAARTGGPALTKSQKFSLLGQEALAAGLADFAVATDGTATVGDFFEGGPTQSFKDTGMSGREEALRRLGNKALLGIEGGALTAAIPPALQMLGKGVVKTATYPIVKTGETATGEAVREGVAPIASRFILDKTGKIGSYSKELEDLVARGEDIGLFKTTLGKSAAALRSRGFLPDEANEVRKLIEGGTQAEVKVANIRLNKIQDGLDKATAKYIQQGAEDSNLARQDFFTKLEDFLTAEKSERAQAFKALPKFARNDARAIRKQIDDLSDDMLNSDYIKSLEGKTNKKGQDLAELARTEIRKNMGSYLRRRYEAFENAKYKVSDENLAIGIEGFKKNKSDTEYELRKLLDTGRYTRSQLGLTDEGKIVGTRVTNKQAKLAAENFLSRKTLANRKVKSGRFGFADFRVQDYQVDTKMFLSRSRIKDYQRALLGEIKDPREQVLGTIADLAEFRAVDNYFGKIRQLATEVDETGALKNPGVAKLFVNTADLTNKQKKGLTKNGYVILGGSKMPGQSPWGSLEDFAVTVPVYNQMTRAVLGDTGLLSSFLRATYGNFLKLKGGSQYAKTVLSPTTQIRNVTTAGAFALANGNFGRGANVIESLKLTMDDIRRLPPERAMTELKELQELGVISSQAELKEIQSLISKGLGLDAKEGARRFGSKFTDNWVGGALGRSGKFAENLYQGGDNIWKIYNYKFELNKLKNALRDAPIEEQVAFLSRGKGLQSGQTVEELFKREAARVVRDTVPNYNMTPDIIKELRRLPTGNFIAFPAEIVRTSANIISRSLDEMASTNKAIQEIGVRRMSGFLGTTAVIPTAMSKFAHDLSGISPEEMRAYQRSVAPNWERNALLLPIGRDEDGKIKYVNFSYSNPYDLMSRIAIGALNRAETERMRGKNTAEIVWSATNEALAEFFNPFTDEAIATAALRDVLDPRTEIVGLKQVSTLVGGRGGVTLSGAKVYNPQESATDKAVKSFTHILGTLMPGFVPLDVRGGEIEPSRFARSVVSALDISEQTGISEKDRRGLERVVTQEVARSLTGISDSDADIPLGLTYKGYEFGQARQDTSNMMNSVARRANVTADDLVEAYKKANEARFRLFNDFNLIIEDMKTAGMSRRQIERKLKEANVGGIDDLLRGRYEPLPELSKTVQENMRRNGTLQEWRKASRRLRSYMRQQSRRDFSTEILEEQEQEQLSQAPTTQATPQPVQTAAAPVQAAPPSNLGTAPLTPSSLNPIVNPDPRTQALAQALAARQQGVG